jgi:hypothetical protein
MDGITFLLLLFTFLKTNGLNGFSKEVVRSLIAGFKITCSALEFKFLQQQIPNKVVLRFANA